MFRKRVYRDVFSCQVLVKKRGELPYLLTGTYKNGKVTAKYHTFTLELNQDGSISPHWLLNFSIWRPYLLKPGSSWIADNWFDKARATHYGNFEWEE